MTKYLRENNRFGDLSDTQKALISHAVNTLGDTGVYVTPESCGFVSEEHAFDCLFRSKPYLTVEGNKVRFETLELLGVYN